MQPFSSHGAVARLCATAFIGCKPNPLSGQGFFGLPISRRWLRGVPRDGRAMGANHLARNPAKYLTSHPRNVPAKAGQWQQQGRRTSVKTTRKTTCLAPDLDAPCPRRKLARQLATWLRNSRATSRKQFVGISPSAFNHDIQKIMNTPTTPTPDLESLRKAIQEFRPNPHRVPFNNLKPLHDAIVELRGKNASYSVIAELLIQNGVKTSRARVAEYGRIVLEDGKKRKRRKRAKTAPAINTPVKPQSVPVVAAKSTPPATPVPTVTSAGSVTPPPTEDSPYRSRGPHIAKVIMMTPSEREEFEASLKSKSPAS
ncbi:MAG: hypothetical protein WAO02_05735 [Verrucomicrobiia bacterium]